MKRRSSTDDDEVLNSFVNYYFFRKKDKLLHHREPGLFYELSVFNEMSDADGCLCCFNGQECFMTLCGLRFTSTSLFKAALTTIKDRAYSAIKIFLSSL